MFSSKKQRSLPFRRSLALLAILFICGGQVLEAQHDHAWHEVTAECLLCQTPAETTVSSNVAPAYPRLVQSGHPACAVPLANTASVSRPPARAPPCYS